MTIVKNSSGTYSLFNSKNTFLGQFPCEESAKSFYDGCEVK